MSEKLKCSFCGQSQGLLLSSSITGNAICSLCVQRADRALKGSGDVIDIVEGDNDDTNGVA